MKRLGQIWLILALACLMLCGSALAKEYTDAKGYIRMDLPENYVVFTSISDFERYPGIVSAMDFDEIRKGMEYAEYDVAFCDVTNDTWIYLDIIESQKSEEIYSFRQMDKKELEIFAHDIRDFCESSDQVRVLRNKTDLESAIHSIRTEMFFYETQRYMMAANSVVSGHGLVFMMVQDEPFTEREYAAMDGVVASILPGDGQEELTPAPKGAPVTYTSDSIRASLPGNWRITERDEQFEAFTRIKFEDDQGCSILLRRQPLDESVSYRYYEKVRGASSVREIDEEMLIDIAVDYGWKNTLSYEQIGGLEYAIVRQNRENIYSDPYCDRLTYCTIKDGYLYRFMLEGPTGDARLDSAEEELFEMVSTARIGEQLPGQSIIKRWCGVPKRLTGAWIPLLIALYLLFFTALYLAPVLIYRIGVKKMPLSRRQAGKWMLLYGGSALILALLLLLLCRNAIPLGIVFPLCIIDYIILRSGHNAENPPAAPRERCPRCGSPLRGGERFCGCCRYPIAEKKDRAKSALQQTDPAPAPQETVLAEEIDRENTFEGCAGADEDKSQ